MKLTFITILLCLGMVSSFAQGYPEPILPGQGKQVASDKDTLWVLTHKQYVNAVSKIKELSVCDEQQSVFKQKVDLLKQQSTEKDSLVSLLSKDRDYYKNYWETSEEDIKSLTAKIRRQKLFGRLTLIGIPAAFIMGIFIAK